MTTFIMGHGNYSGPDTFVPAGGSVGIYAQTDTLLAITIGMAVLTRVGGVEPPTVFRSTDEPPVVHNYRIGPLTHPEYARMHTVESAKNQIIYIGFTPGFEAETQLCTDLKGCRNGRHTCQGILGRVKDPDIRLTFCVGKASASGLSGMTTTLPDTAAYQEANAHLALYVARAKDWFERITRNPEVAIPEFHKLATTAQGAREASFVLASSRKLESALVLDDARRHRRSLSAWDFLTYLYGLPEKSRAKVTRRLRTEAFTPIGPAPVTALDRFVASFFTAGTLERRAGWAALTPQDRQRGAENHLLGFWATHIVPVIDVYQQGWESPDQPAGWFASASFRSPLTEFGEAEAQLAPGYVASFDACMAFGRTADPAACLALWRHFEGNPEARRLLSTVTRVEDPKVWEREAQPTTGTNPLAAWLDSYRRELAAASAAATRAATKSVPVLSSSSSSSEDIFTVDEFADFWDDLDQANRRACRAWSRDRPVHVIELNGHFRFATWSRDLAAAFPTAAWNTFKVVELGFTNAAIQQTVDGIHTGVFNLVAFGGYLSARLPEITVQP
ncbi:hypothetical protein [Kitasatospora sp. NPDC057015]|uniref:hypothetical protein n=1 Tax=Kitasatospora sp. NPDC057015 TaxID=3346001 RepID=UPI003630AFBC